MPSSFQRALRVLRNLALDLRFGGFLGGAAGSSRFRAQGANDANNSDYGLLPQIFADRIRADDVLVDVGSGRGRVLNWWLARGLRNPLYGLELDPDIAASAAARLRRWPTVRVLAGDAVANLPAHATLLYLFNPFDAAVMTRFADAVLSTCTELHRLRIFYYAPEHVDVFQDDPRWQVELIELDMRGQPPHRDRHRRLAIVRPTPPDTHSI